MHRHWYKPYALVVLLGWICFGSVAQALGLAEIQNLAGEVRRQLLSAEATADLAERAPAYEDALRAFDALTRVRDTAQNATEDSAYARRLLVELEAGGVSRDLFIFGHFTALRALAANMRSHGQDAGDVLVKADALAREITTPTLQSTALLDIAGEYGEHEPARAVRFLGLALERIVELTDSPERSVALRDIVETAFAIGPPALAIADDVLAQLADARLRSDLRHRRAQTIVRVNPGKSALRDAVAAGDDTQQANGLAALSRSASAAGTLDDALLAAELIPPDAKEVRKDTLRSIHTAALSAQRFDIATGAALSVAGTGLQSDLLLAIVRAHLAANHPDPARASANLIIEKTTAADAFTLIGKHLARNDYRTQAEEVFGKALDTLAVARRQARENAQGIAEQTAATLKTMADNGFGTAAAQSLDTLPAGALRARVVAAIAKNEAEQGELANAAKLYAELGAGEAQSRAAAALAKAFADANQLDAAKRYAAAATATDDDRGRAWHGIARALAKNGDSAGALAALANISSPIWRIDALAQIAKAEAQRGDHDAAAQHFAQALALIPSLGDADARARALRTVLDAKSAAGDDAGARQIIEQIPDKTERSAALARQLAQQGQLPDALGVARAIADDSTRVQTLRWIAEGATLTNDVYGLLSREHPAGTTQSPTPPDAAATTAAVVGPRNPIKLSAQFDLRILDAAALGQRLPHPPQFEARASGVRARVPPIAPGNADEALMIYSQYNKKFFEDTEGESGGRNRLSKLQNDDNPRYIYLNSGVFNLDAIIHDLHGTGGETAVVRSGDVVTVRLPILISPTATLVISGNEVSEVRLSATSGGFIVNAGKLFVTDTRVVGFDEAKNAISRVFSKDSDAFRPFILSWSNSVTQLANSTFIALGYRSTKAFGVALSSGPTTITKDDPRSKRPTGVVVENSFENCYYGFYSYEADDVLVIGNEYRDNIIYGIDPHDRSHRLIIAYNTAYGTLVKHGIIISREVDYSAIIGNVTFANHGSGFMLDRDSVETLVYANTAFANRQDGLSIFESSCNIAASNHLFDNGRAGVKIRNSWDVALFQNRIVGNKGAGVEGYIVRLENSRAGATRDFELDPYTRLTTFTAVGNLIRANTAGIKALGVTGMTVVGNEFVHQTPLLFGGDLRPHTQALLSGSASQPSSGALITSTCQPPPPQRCSFRATGLFAGDGQEALFSSSANAPRCDEIPGTVQHQALVRTNGISAANESNEE